MNDPQRMTGTLHRPALRAWFVLGPILLVLLTIHSLLSGGSAAALLAPILALVIVVVGLRMASGMLPGGGIALDLGSRFVSGATRQIVGAIRGPGPAAPRGAPANVETIDFRLRMASSGQILGCRLVHDDSQSLRRGDQVTLTGRKHRSGRFHVHRIRNRSTGVILHGTRGSALRAEYAARAAWVICAGVLIAQVPRPW